MKMTKEKGITLIALVITIIIMLILVSITISLSVNGGLFDYASKSTKETEKAMQEEKRLADVKGNLTTDALIAKYTNKWYEVEEGVYSNGEDEVTVGDYVEYKCYDSSADPADLTYTSYSLSHASSDKNDGRTSGYSVDQTFTVDESSNSINWRVLGVEDGHLLLVMESQNSNGVTKGLTLGGKEGYLYGADEINAICAIYGHGKNAIGARSITEEEVNRLTGYDPLHAESSGTKPYGNGKAWQYKNGPVTYTLGSNGKVSYTYDNGRKSGTSNNTVLRNLGESTSSGQITVEESTHYQYTSSITSNVDNKNLIYGESSTYKYWFASSYIFASGGSIRWGIRSVYNGQVFGNKLWDTVDGKRSMGASEGLGVRPVVILNF